MRNKFLVLRGFAIPLPPYRAFPPYYTSTAGPHRPAVFLCDTDRLSPSNGGGMAEENKRQDISDTVEDALGFNFRSLKTLLHLFIKPRQVFLAYAARDRVTYTPAIRLFFTLVGLQVLISALWGGWEGLLTAQINTMPEAQRAQFEELAGGDMATYVGHYADAAGFLQPVLTALFTSLSVFVLGWFRPQLTWPSRLNIAMGVLTIGTVAGIALTPMLMAPNFQQMTWLASGGVAIVYLITMLRGSYGVIADTWGGVVGKSILFTLALMLLIMLAGFVLALVCATYAFARMSGGG